MPHLAPSPVLALDLDTLTSLGVTESTLYHLTNALARMIATLLRQRDDGDALADLWLSTAYEDRYPIARVFSREIRFDYQPDLDRHRVGLDAARRFRALANDPAVRHAFGAYASLAYCGEVRDDRGLLLEELETVSGYWGDALDILEEGNICVFQQCDCSIEEIEALAVIESIRGCWHCYRLNCSLCESQPCRCDRCIELQPNHDENCWCRICAPKHYARLALEAADEPRVIERRIHARQRSRRDFADERELPGFLRCGECPYCGQGTCACFDD